MRRIPVDRWSAWAALLVLSGAASAPAQSPHLAPQSGQYAQPFYPVATNQAPPSQAPLPWYAGGCPTSGSAYEAGGPSPLLGLSSVGCGDASVAPNWTSGEPAEFGPAPGCQQLIMADGWYVGAAALLIMRTDENPYMFSYDSANESIQLTDSRDSNMGFAGGVELRLGRYFDCG